MGLWPVRRDLRRLTADFQEHEAKDDDRFHRLEQHLNALRREVAGVKGRVAILGALVVGSGLLNYFGHS